MTTRWGKAALSTFLWSAGAVLAHGSLGSHWALAEDAAPGGSVGDASPGPSASGEIAAGASDSEGIDREGGQDVAANEYGNTGAEAINSSVTDEAATGGGSSSYFGMNYTNIFYGPSIQDPSSFQPTAEGERDEYRPIFMKNFLSASYGFDEKWAITGTAYWWYRPVLGQEFTIQDPFARVSNASLFSTSWGLNLYTDLRVHFGVTSASRDADLIGGLQNFSYLTFQPGYGSWLFAIRASARGNIYGNSGNGTDAEFYLAPEVNYRLSDKFAFTLLYEMGASHQLGDDASYITNDGTDLQPGLEWDPTPDLVINPYVTLLTGGKVSLASTSVGMFVTWNFL